MEYEKHGICTVGYADKIQITAKSGLKLSYYFYYEGKRIDGSISFKNFDKTQRDKYYVAQFSSQHPWINRILLDEKISEEFQNITITQLPNMAAW